LACAAAFQNPPAAVVGLLVFLFRYRRKRVKLTCNQGLVLQALKQAGLTGVTSADVVKRLPAGCKLTQPTVDAILQELRTLRQEDGLPANLVSEEDGVWRALAIL
jgi:hypothetical protein